MVFDDMVSDGDGKGAWTYVCDRHLATVERNYRGARDSNPTECICGVEGCANEADYYFTFYSENNLVVLN